MMAAWKVEKLESHLAVLLAALKDNLKDLLMAIRLELLSVD